MVAVGGAPAPAVHQVSDRVIFMDDGRVSETGTPEVLFSRPQNPRTQEFLRAILQH